MTTLALLTLLLVISRSVYGDSTAGNETCHDRGVLGRLDSNTKSCVVAQQSLSESLQSLTETLQSLLQAQQATTSEIVKAQKLTETDT